MREQTALQRGLNRKIVPEIARIAKLDDSAIRLSVEQFEPKSVPVLTLNFRLDGELFRFQSDVLHIHSARVVDIAYPRLILRAERRDRSRAAPLRPAEVQSELLLHSDNGVRIRAIVNDASAGGYSVDVPRALSNDLPSMVQVEQPGQLGGVTRTAEVRHVTPLPSKPGFVRVGLHFIGGTRGVQVERRREALRGPGGLMHVLQGWRSMGSALWSVSPLRRHRGEGIATPRIIDIPSENGETIRAIVDSWGATRGAPAVVIPPAWGRTKETLLPLAMTIVETFRRADTPIVVVRFDGIRKRGESTNECRGTIASDEHLRFTFSQGVRDIDWVLRFLEHSTEFQTRRSALVTFSASSIEGRRAVRVAQERSLAGWICVVGSADLQSMMRSISGGVDFVAGIERGLSFGLQEILGVVVDIDYAGRDAIAEGLAYLEDSCADFEKIRIPVTWFHGAYDSWMDQDRVRHALSFGDTARRRLIEIPTGHQLRTSQEALRVFARIAEEVAALLLEVRIPGRLPDLALVRQRQKAERARLPRKTVARRKFWEQYLLGRDQSVGIELMTRTSPHRDLMTLQIERLKLKSGDRVADIGCGAGAFLDRLADASGIPDGLSVLSLDIVIPALDRARQCVPLNRPLTAHFVACDLTACGARAAIPLGTATCDAILASLVVSYVTRPGDLLKELARILRPGGRLVLSTLQPDADVSRIFFKGLSELRSGDATLGLGRDGRIDVDTAARGFLNDAARLLDLEEEGEFEFWDGGGLSRLVRSAGFRSVSVESAFGDPPQAFVATAVKPRMP